MDLPPPPPPHPRARQHRAQSGGGTGGASRVLTTALVAAASLLAEVHLQPVPPGHGTAHPHLSLQPIWISGVPCSQ